MSGRPVDTDALYGSLDRLAEGDDRTAPLVLPAALVEALHAADGLGFDAAARLRSAVEAFAHQLAIDSYCAHLGWRPSLTELAVAAAQLDGSPLADDPELLARAAEGVVSVVSDAGARDVLVFAAGMRAR